MDDEAGQQSNTFETNEWNDKNLKSPLCVSRLLILSRQHWAVELQKFSFNYLIIFRLHFHKLVNNICNPRSPNHPSLDGHRNVEIDPGLKWEKKVYLPPIKIQWRHSIRCGNFIFFFLNHLGRDFDYLHWDISDRFPSSSTSIHWRDISLHHHRRNSRRLHLFCHGNVSISNKRQQITLTTIVKFIC